MLFIYRNFQFPPAQSHPSIPTLLFPPIYLYPHPSISSPQLHTQSFFPYLCMSHSETCTGGPWSSLVILGWPGKARYFYTTPKSSYPLLDSLLYIQVPTYLSYKMFLQEQELMSVTFLTN